MLNMLCLKIIVIVLVKELGKSVLFWIIKFISSVIIGVTVVFLLLNNDRNAAPIPVSVSGTISLILFS